MYLWFFRKLINSFPEGYFPEYCFISPLAMDKGSSFSAFSVVTIFFLNFIYCVREVVIPCHSLNVHLPKEKSC